MTASAAGAAHACAPDRLEEVLVDVALDRVEGSRFDDHARIVVGDRCAEHRVGILRGRGKPDSEPGNVCQQRLEALGVLRARAGRRSLLRPHDEGRVRPARCHVADVRRLVDELVEGNEEEVRPHHLHDRPEPLERGADRSAEDRALADRRVEHALGAELLLQPPCDPEDATCRADVLAEDEHVGSALELVAECPVDRLAEGERFEAGAGSPLQPPGASPR